MNALDNGNITKSSHYVCNVEDTLRKIVDLAVMAIKDNPKIGSDKFEVYPLTELLSVLIDHYGPDFFSVIGINMSYEDYIKSIFENCYAGGMYYTITSSTFSRPLLLELCSINFILVTYFQDYLEPYNNELRSSVDYIIKKWSSKAGKFSESDLKEDVLCASRKIGHYSYLLNYMATMMFVSMREYFSKDSKILHRINNIIADMSSISKQDFLDVLDSISSSDLSSLSYCDLEQFVYRFVYNYWILKLCNEEYLDDVVKQRINQIFALFSEWLKYYINDFEHVLQEISDSQTINVIQVERSLRELITKRINLKLRKMGSEFSIFISVVPHVLRAYVSLVKEFVDSNDVDKYIRDINLIVSVLDKYVSVVHDNAEVVIENFEYVKAYYSIFYISLLDYRDLVGRILFTIDDLIWKKGASIDFAGLVNLLTAHFASEDAYIVCSNIYIDQSLFSIFKSVCTFILPDIYPYNIVILPERNVAIVTNLPLTNIGNTVVGKYYIAKDIEFENILSHIGSYIYEGYRRWYTLLGSGSLGRGDNEDKETLKLIVDVLSVLVDDITKGEIVKELISDHGIEALKAVYNYYRLDPKYHELNVAKAMGLSSDDKLDVEYLLAEKKLYSRVYNWKDILDKITVDISKFDRIYNYVFDVESSELFFRYLSSLSEKDLKTALSKFGIHELYIHDIVYNKYRELIELIDSSPADVGKVKKLSDLSICSDDDIRITREEVQSVKTTLKLEGLIDEDIDVISHVLCLNRHKGKRHFYGLITNTYEVARCAKEFKDLWDVTFALLNVVSMEDGTKDAYRNFGKFLRVPLKYLIGIFD